MESKKPLNLYTIPLSEMDRVFAVMFKAYEETFRWLTRRKDERANQAAEYQSFRDYISEAYTEISDNFVMPQTMQGLLGYGITPSMGHHTYQKPSKVGEVLHVWHHEMRKIGMEWGKRYVGNFSSEINPYIEYLVYPAKRKDIILTESQLDSPKLQAQLIANKVIDYFDSLPFFELTDLEGNIVKVPNSFVTVTSRNYEADPPIREEYKVSIASIAWGIRQAGISIKGRAEDDPTRYFAERVIGIEKEAGRKMQLLAQVAPNVYDYPRETIHKVLETEAVWIKTIIAVMAIYNKNPRPFADALGLIEQDPTELSFGSAMKTGVLLYALVDKLESTVSEHFNLSSWHSRIEQGEGIVDAHSVIRQVKVLSLQLIELGENTEKELEEAKESFELTDEKIVIVKCV